MTTVPVLPRALIGVVFAGFVFSGAAFAQSYSVSVIPPPSGYTIESISGMNNSGQSAGEASNGQAFIGSPGGSVLIPVPAGWRYTAALAINNLGQVAGAGVTPTTYNQAFIGTASGISAVPLPPGLPPFSDALGVAINDSGQVAGFAGPYSQAKFAFIGTASTATILPPPPGWSVGGASGVNAFGQVVGFGNNGYADQAFVATISGASPVPIPPGWNWAEGFAINDSGQVVGLGNNGTTFQAFIGTSSASSVIPLPTGATQVQVDRGCLNNSGVVVGKSDVGGWIWSASTGTRLLNTMVPSGWNISNAVSISNNGRILAQGSLNGGASQYVELTPAGLPTTPAPRSGLLVIGGLLLVSVWRFGSSWIHRKEIA